MKKLLTVAWFILASFHLSFGAAISGTQVNDTIVPTDTTDEYPTHDDQYGRSHWLLVANAAERTSLVEPAGISEQRRTLGMIVFQLDTGNVWRLTGFPNTWTDLGVFNATAATANIYTQDGTLLANRVITGAGKTLTFSGLADWGITGTATSTVQGLNLYLNGTSTVNINQSGNHFRFPFIAAALASDDTLLLQNPSTKDVKRSTVTLAQTLAQTNIFNTTGTLTGPRSLLGGGYDFTIQNVATLTQSANTLTQGAGTITVASTGNATVSAVTNLSLSGTEVRLNNSGSKYIFKNTPTTAASTDEILGIDVATGEVRHAASATIANIAAASTFYNSSGALSGNRTVTGGGYNLSFSGIGNAVRSSTTVSEAATTTASYSATDLTIIGVNSISFNTPNVEVNAAEIGQYLRLGNTSGSVEFATAFYTGSATQTGAAYAVSNTDLVPDYDSASQHAAGTIAYVTLNAASVGADTLKLGPSTDALGIVHQDGTVIAANELSANYPYTFVKVGTGGSGKWVLQGASSSTTYTPLANRSAVVSTVADLVALDPIRFNSAATKGYYVADDGGAGTYYWVSNQTSTNYGAKIASASSGSWVLIAPNVNVLQWGAKRDGVTSASARIQAAMTHAMTNTVRHLVIPPGDYSFTSGILGAADNLKVDIYGRCKNAAGTNSYLFSFNNASAKTHSAGVLTSGLVATNVVIDGHGVGIIDGNSPNSTTFDIDTQMGTHGNHAFVIDRHGSSTVKNLRVQNGVSYGIYAGTCDGLTIQNCVVINGTARNATRAGALRWGTFQDGLHLVDCSRSKVINNYVEGSDDAIGCDAYFLKCGDNLISGNTIKQVFRCINPVTGLYYTNYMSGSAAVYVGTGSTNQYACITNVIVSNNQIIGGATSGGGLHVRMGAVANLVAENILFEGNTLSGLNNPGDPSVSPNGVGIGIALSGGKNITFRGNKFHQYNRLMSMSVLDPKPSGLVFDGNEFYDSPIRAGNHLSPSLATALIDVAYAEDVVIRNNTFNNVYEMPIRVGAIDNTNAVSRAVISGNKIINANLRYTDTNTWAAGVPTNRAYAIYVSGVPDYTIDNNLISTNAGGAISVGFAVGRGVIRNNTIDKTGVTGMTLNAATHGIQVANSTTNASISTEVSGNILTRIGGCGILLVDAGWLDVRDNTVDTVATVHSGQGIYTLLQGTISDLGYTRHGGAFGRNVIRNTGAEPPFYFFSVATNTTSHTGGRLVFDASEQVYGGTVGATYFSPGFFGLMTATPGYVTTGTGYSAKPQDTIINVTAAAAITLPDAVVNYGKRYTVKRSTGSTVTVVSSGAQTFDGVASPYTLVSSADFVSDGANWIVTSAF